MRILFYTANGVGLGHLRRTSSVAESIRKLDSKTNIIFAAMCKEIFFLNELKISYVKFKHLTDNLLKDRKRFIKAKLFNQKKFLEVVNKHKPDLITLDVYLFGFSFPEIILSSSFDDIIKVLIFRKNDEENFCKIIQENKKVLDKFQRIILPHSLIELKETLPRKEFDYINKNDKFIISGPIFKKIYRGKLSFCRRKYKISPKDFLILVTLGAGGKLKGGQCEPADKMISTFSDIRSSLMESIHNLKTIIIPGPYSQKRGQKFEKYLPELIKISDLVISTAGYNTCNEIIQAKTPAVLIPLMRGDKEQFEKADYLEKKGVVRVCKDISPENLLNSILYCKNNLSKMKNNFRKFSDWKQGNDKAAKEILNLLK